MSGNKAKNLHSNITSICRAHKTVRQVHKYIVIHAGNQIREESLRKVTPMLSHN